MMKKVTNSFLTTEDKYRLYEEGYRYIVEGDYKVLDSIDRWTGTPKIDRNIYAFVDKTEAEIFAKAQIWPWNPNLHAQVKGLVRPIETAKERETKAKEISIRITKKEIAELEAELARKKAYLRTLER